MNTRTELLQLILKSKLAKEEQVVLTGVIDGLSQKDQEDLLSQLIENPEKLSELGIEVQSKLDYLLGKNSSK